VGHGDLKIPTGRKYLFGVFFTPESMPMTRSPDRRFPLACLFVRSMVGLMLLPAAEWLCSQQPLQAGRNAAPKPAAAAGAGTVTSPTLLNRDARPAAPLRADSSGFAPFAGSPHGSNSPSQSWDPSLYDAFQPGAGSFRLTGTGRQQSRLDSLAPFYRVRNSSPGFGRPASPGAMFPSLSPELRSGNELRFSSSAGTLRFNQGLGGRGYYPVARMDPGAPLASFTTPNLGSSLMNFSASTYMGGTVYGAQKHTGPSISLRLNF
jgi:hypothetical protein